MKRIAIIVVLLLSFSNVFSQKNVINATELTNESIGFNFFTGNSPDLFRTTPKAFGSGIYDLSGQYGFTYWLVKPDKSNIGLGLGIAYKLNKYRFENNLFFNTTMNQIEIDINPLHSYDEMFFSRQGSKLVTGKIHVPFLIYLPVSQWLGDKNGVFGIFGSIFYDGFLFAYHKLYFEENGVLMKNKTGNSEIKKYFNKNFYGVRAGIKIGSFIIFGQHNFVPLFNNNLPYELYETKVGVNLIIKSKNPKDILDNITETR